VNLSCTGAVLLKLLQSTFVEKKRVDQTAELPEAPDSPAAEADQQAPATPAPGGSRELLSLATPLIVSQSFMTVQVFVDTILLAWHDPREMAASFPAVMWFWLPFGFDFRRAVYGRGPAAPGRPVRVARHPLCSLGGAGDARPRPRRALDRVHGRT
jgi:hypothetical protein